MSNKIFMDIARSHVVLVAGKRGSGKSYTLGVIAEELANLTYQMAYRARQNNVTALTYYDASFVALAQQEGAVLVTDNPKHQTKISDVEVIPLEKFTLDPTISKNRARKK